MRVALLAPNGGRQLGALAAGLSADGLDAHMVGGRVNRGLERRLRRRGFETPLTHVVGSHVALSRGSFELAHAFDAPDAAAVAKWARENGRVAVFTLPSVPDRSWLVARRLRLECVLRAVRGCGALVVPSAVAADALRASLGAAARVIEPGVDLRSFVPRGERTARPSVLFPAGASELLFEAFSHVRRARGAATLIGLPHDPGAYRRAWVAVVPPGVDGVELISLQSLACGTPVVEAAPDLLAADLAEMILEGLELAGDPGTAEACRRRAEQFSIERSIAAHAALYRELLAERGP